MKQLLVLVDPDTTAAAAAAGAQSDVPDTVPPAAAPAASQAGAAGPQLVTVGNKTFAFYGDLVCGICSARGHAAPHCNAAFCLTCGILGHDAAE